MTILEPPGADYTIHTEIYEGPLDLLLDLISKAELDITKLSLARVTDQYLDYIANMGNISPVHVSGFILVAAKLIQIKSEALLPRPPEREEGEEDPGESLARQLRIYKAIKNSSNWLKSLEDTGEHTYIRLAPPPIISNNLSLDGITINDLIEMLRNLYRFEEDAVPVTSVIAIPKVTIKNKIRDIIKNLQTKKHLSFQDLLPKSADRIEAIVLFLAILELVKQQYVETIQEKLFSDICISATDKTFQDEEEFSLALDG